MLPSTAKRFQAAETQLVTNTAALCPQLVPDSGRRHWQCPLEGCVLGSGSDVFPFPVGSQGWKHQGADCHGSSCVPAGIRAGKVLTTGLSAVTTLLYQEGKHILSLLSSAAGLK